MIFKYMKNALKGRNHQHRATPCDCRTDPLQAPKGREPKNILLSPLQGLNLRVFPFHRALPDANAIRLSALTTVMYH